MNSTDTTRLYFLVILALVLLSSLKWDKTEPKPIPFGVDPRQVVKPVPAQGGLPPLLKGAKEL
jgi:hypothetical protein